MAELIGLFAQHPNERRQQRHPLLSPERVLPQQQRNRHLRVRLRHWQFNQQHIGVVRERSRLQTPLDFVRHVRSIPRLHDRHRASFYQAEHEPDG